jgi:uncharacterized protein (DUF927 family)
MAKPQELAQSVFDGLSKTGKQAVIYARRGLFVFPCRERTTYGPGLDRAGKPKEHKEKSPYTANGCHDATTDLSQIVEWWRRWPDAAIGSRTGVASGLFVIDVDVKHGARGAESWAALQETHGAAPKTRTAKTASGGGHYYYKHPGQGKVVKTNSGQIADGVDIRGDKNGFVIMPESVVESGPYSWEHDIPTADAPEWLLDLVIEKPKPEAKPCQKITATLSTPYGKTAVEEECKAIADAPAGQRHEQLFKSVAALGGLISGGEVVEAEARAGIMEAVESWNTGAESEGKTLDTIEDALATGMIEPRQAPPLISGGAPGAGGASPGWPGVQVCPGYENKSGAPGAGGGKVGSAMPRNYFVNAAGLHYVDDSNPDKDPVTYRLGPFIEVVARTRDATSAEWGLLVRWRDPDGVLHEWSMPATRLFAQDGGWIAELARCGWTPEPGAKQRALLAAFFAKVSPSARVRCVLRVGWYDGRFILPGQVYGLGQEPVVLQSRMASDPYTQRGELAAWQDTIGQWSRGNSRLILAVCLALSGPLLSVVGMGPGGVNLFGGSSSGKTTSLHAALSVWGGPESKNSWNATKNGLEGALELHNDTFYTLDEMAEAPGKTMTEVVYMLGNGAGRARANQDGSARAVRRWCCSILSTGEIGVEEKLRQEGQLARAGHGVRLLEVPADAGAGLGCWEDLHGYESGRDFSEAIDAASRENYGHAGRAFVQILAERMKELALTEDLDAFSNKWTPSGAAGQVGRVVRRFAIMAVAGEVAARTGVLPWTPGEALRGIKRCLDDWMQARGGADDAEATYAVREVLKYIARYGQSRFESLGNDHSERIIDRSGFKRVVDGKTQFVLTPDQLGTILPGQNLAQAVKALDRVGILRRNEGRLTQKVIIPDLGRPRCYVLELPEDGGAAC